MSRQVVFLALLCIVVTGATFLAVGVEAALCCAILSLVVFVFFLVVSLRRRAEIRRLTDEIDEVLNLGRCLSFSNCREGDIAVLANELEKMVARLARLTAQLESEKTSLADSLADISHQIRTPLTAAELMLPAIERVEGEEQRKILVRDLEHLLDRVSWLVATLLKMAKVDAGRCTWSRASYASPSAVARACEPLALPLDLRDTRSSRPSPTTPRSRATRPGVPRQSRTSSRTRWSTARPAGRSPYAPAKIPSPATSPSATTGPAYPRKTSPPLRALLPG